MQRILQHECLFFIVSVYKTFLLLISFNNNINQFIIKWCYDSAIIDLIVDYTLIFAGTQLAFKLFSIVSGKITQFSSRIGLQRLFIKTFLLIHKNQFLIFVLYFICYIRLNYCYIQGRVDLRNHEWVWVLLKYFKIEAGNCQSFERWWRGAFSCLNFEVASYITSFYLCT